MFALYEELHRERYGMVDEQNKLQTQAILFIYLLFVCLSVCLVGQSVDRSDGRSLSQSVGRSVGSLVCMCVGFLIFINSSIYLSLVCLPKVA